MKKFATAAMVLAVLAAASTAAAQVRPFSQLTFPALEAGQPDGGIDLDIHIGRDRDQPDSDPDRDRNDRHRIGGWGGFGFGYFLPQLHGFDGLTEDRGLDGEYPLMDTWAGRGFVTWDGFRFGGMGGYGSFHESEIVDGDDRSASIHVGYGGVAFDYLLPLGTDRVGILLGAAMGGGGTWISARGEDLGDDERWDEYTGFRFFAPEVGLSILTIPWVRIEFTAQYLFMDINLEGSEFVSDAGEQLIDADWMGGPIYTMWFMFGSD